MSHFEPRRLFRRARIDTLRAYFSHKKIPVKVDWDALEPNAWQEVMLAWSRLPDADNATVAADFYDMAMMAEEAGLRALLEANRLRKVDLTLTLESAEDPLDFVMRQFVEHPAAWEIAVRFATADMLSTGRSWQRYDRLPAFVPDGSDAACERLREGLSAYFRRTEGRGQHGVVEHAKRAGGVHVFAAYLSDYPLAREILVNRHELRRAVDTGRVFPVFISCPSDGGTVDICANGGRKVRDEVLRIFGHANPEVEFRVDPTRAPGRYQIGQLRRRRSLSFDPTEVADARIRRLSFRVIGGGKRTIEIKADPENGPLDIYDVLEHWFDHERVPPNNIDLRSVTFAVRLPQITGRAPTFSFTVTRSGSCNLRSQKEAYRELGEKLLVDWRIDVRGSLGGAAGARPTA